MSEEKTHHLYGSSSAKQWATCAGWALIFTKLAEEPPGPAALRGTDLHTGILERRLAREINFRLTGEPVGVIDYSDLVYWPDEGEEYAEEFFNYVWKEVLEEFVTGKTILIEKKLMLFPDLDCGGTGDLIVLWYNDKGKLVASYTDCKFGRVRVEPSSEQNKFLLVALNKAVKEKGRAIDEFISNIYQPSHHKRWTTHRFTKSEIEKAELKYEKIILESRKPDPKFKAGDHCEWCKCRGKCPEYTKLTDKRMEAMVLRTKDTVKFADVESLPDNVIANVILYEDKITNQLKAIKKEGYLRLIAGHKIEGLKLVEATGNRSLEDSPTNRKYLEANGISPVTSKIIGIGEAVKRFTEKGLKPKEAKELVGKITTEPKTYTTITTADDDRPEIVIRDPSSLLEGIDDSDACED